MIRRQPPDALNPRSVNPRRQGFTLIELLVAIALMAVLAVISLRALDSVLLSRDMLTANSQELQRLSALFAQVDADLRQLPPAVSNVPMFGAQAAEPDPQAVWVRDAALAGEASRLVLIGYRLREGRIERLMVPLKKTNIEDTDWQPLLTQVKRVTWQRWEPTGWAPLTVQALQPQAPIGLELTVERSDGRKFVRVYALRN